MNLSVVPYINMTIIKKLICLIFRHKWKRIRQDFRDILDGLYKKECKRCKYLKYEKI